MSDPYIAPSNPISRAGAGVVAGIAGGVVGAIVLTVAGAMRPIGNIIGKSSIQGGWMVLLVVAAVAGAAYGLFAGRHVSAQVVPAIGIGIFYGGAWWILIELIMVPLRAGHGIFAFPGNGMFVLAGYVVFGVILGIVYASTGPRRRVPYRRFRDSNAYNTVYALPRQIRSGPRARPRRRARKRD